MDHSNVEAFNQGGLGGQDVPPVTEPTVRPNPGGTTEERLAWRVLMWESHRRIVREMGGDPDKIHYGFPSSLHY